MSLVPAMPARRRRTLALALAAAVVTVAATCLTLLSAGPAGAAVVANTFYNVVNVNSGKCVDARAAATANGTAVQQFTCNGTGAQEWEFQPTSNGNFRVNAFNDVTKVWDVTNVSTADSAPIQLWAYGGGANQQWAANQNSDGSFTFVSLNSGKCLDVPGASTADSVQLQQFTCNGTGAQKYNLNPVGGPPTTNPPPPPGQPNFGPNVFVFDPSMSSSAIQNQLNTIFNEQASNQFGTNRFAVLFKPGTYNVDVNIGFYEQVLGLGLNPDNVDINGQVHVQADWNGGNATENFWRGAENMEVNPPGGTDTWAVSQADPFRRMDVRGDMQLDNNGFSSGGFIADSNITGQIRSGSQQQFLTRNSNMGSWSGSNWNMVFVGDNGAPGQSFSNPPFTTVNTTPVVQEKPFLYVDNAGNYNVFVPALRSNTAGPSWTSGSEAGSSLPISQFFIAHPGDSAETINAALANGQNLLFTPGIYGLDNPINVTRPDTVVLGMGLATLQPTNGTAAMTVADVNGVKIGGLLFDATPTNSPVLLQMGAAGSNADHTADPSSLDDVFFRIGGAGVGRATQTLVINSNNVITDDMWLWRADHGSGVGWTTNTAQNGMIVNGQNVTAYGLFVEHYQQYQVIWNGNGGRTYFYQSEMPYDPPNQAAWMNGSTRGFASYKVSNNVTSHQAFGLGIYCFFEANPGNVADHAIETPTGSGIGFHDMVTVSLGGTGTIQHIINNNGGSVNSGNTVTDLNSGP